MSTELGIRLDDGVENAKGKHAVLLNDARLALWERDRSISRLEGDLSVAQGIKSQIRSWDEREIEAKARRALWTEIGVSVGALAFAVTALSCTAMLLLSFG